MVTADPIIYFPNPDQEEEKKKTEMKEHARKELDDWYKHHKEAIEKTRSANRWMTSFTSLAFAFCESSSLVTELM